jgi:hypothetical protein
MELNNDSIEGCAIIPVRPDWPFAQAEVEPGVVLHFGQDGTLVLIQVLDFPRHCNMEALVKLASNGVPIILSERRLETNPS